MRNTLFETISRLTNLNIVTIEIITLSYYYLTPKCITMSSCTTTLILIQFT